MTIFALVIVIFILTSLIAWLDWNNRKERSKLVNALIARNAEQLRDLEFVEKLQPPRMEQSTTPDVVPMDALDDEEFEKFIQEGQGEVNG